MSGTLFVVGTPIGNLEDVSDRMRRVLGSVDVVAAEDTRHTGRLLARLGVRARLVSFFEGNEEQRVPELVFALREGMAVALVTDAGMPGISDPGYRLVAACVAQGIEVDVVPGPSAVTVALAISGLPTDRFVFEGFLPRSGRTRRDRLEALAGEPRTIVLFESPRRVGATLRDLLSACGDRRVALCRELTKLHQEVLRGSLSEVVASLEGRELRGEVTVVVEGGQAPSSAAASDPLEEAARLARELVASGARKREAARHAAATTGVASSAVYQRLVDGQAD
jgi:16S rRNA (cytidine1402-2'-O)-methyltransferase